MGVIYKATSLITNLSYIGQAKNFEVRKSQHLKAKDYYDFHIALREQKPENFKQEILEECDNDLLNEREIYQIAFYDTYNNGYNMTKGGDNADALDKWRKTHKEEVLKNALNGLQYANKRNKEHREECLIQLEEARKKAVDTVKRKVRCIEKDIIFDSLTDAEKQSASKNNDNGKVASHQHIAHVCRGHRKTCGGYHQEYVD